MLNFFPHGAHVVHGDAPAFAAAAQADALGVGAVQHRLGVGAALRVQVVRRQTARGKARAAARLAHQQNRMGQPPGAQCRAQLGL